MEIQLIKMSEGFFNFVYKRDFQKFILKSFVPLILVLFILTLFAYIIYPDNGDTVNTEREEYLDAVSTSFAPIFLFIWVFFLGYYYHEYRYRDKEKVEPKIKQYKAKNDYIEESNSKNTASEILKEENYDIPEFIEVSEIDSEITDIDDSTKE